MQVIILAEANKQFHNLPKNEQKKIQKKLSQLSTNPFAGKKLSGGLDAYRSLRAWPYRILYYIHDRQNKIFVATIAHRQGVYN